MEVDGVGWRWWLGWWLEVAEVVGGDVVLVVGVCGCGWWRGRVAGWAGWRGDGGWMVLAWVRGCGEGRGWGGRRGGGRLVVVLVGGWMRRMRRARVGVWVGGWCVLVWRGWSWWWGGGGMGRGWRGVVTAMEKGIGWW